MSSSNWQAEKHEKGTQLLKGLLRTELLQTWYRNRSDGWEWISGRWAPIYTQIRYITSYPDLLYLASDGLGKTLIHEAGYDQANHRVVGIDYAGRPLSDGITLIHGIPSLGTRKLAGIRTVDEVKEYISKYGAHSLVEGKVNEGDVVAFVDDIKSFFDSKLIAAAQFEHHLQINRIQNVRHDDVGVLIDYQLDEGVLQAAQAGFSVYSFIPFRTVGIHLLKGDLTNLEFDVISDFLEDPRKYQDPELQQHLRQLAEQK